LIDRGIPVRIVKDDLKMGGNFWLLQFVL